MGTEDDASGPTAVDHPAGAVRVAALRLRGDPDRVTAWLGPTDLPLEVRPGKAELEAVVLVSDSGEIVF